jgi:DNA ligase D-like protein (predicted ligase)
MSGMPVCDIDLATLPSSSMTFVEPMLPKAVSQLPEGANWQYEIKWDGYRALAIRAGGKRAVVSRRNNSFVKRFPSIVTSLNTLEDGIILDGEIVAFDAHDAPSFNLLQHHASNARSLVYFVFDVLAVRGRDVRRLTLAKRRELLDDIMRSARHPLRRAPVLDAAPSALIRAVEAQGLEGIVAKRIESHYESRGRSGAWVKFKVNGRQELVIGGYRPGEGRFDHLAVGYYDDRDRLRFVAKVRNGFTVDLKAEIVERLRKLATTACPFDNLPQSTTGRWGEGLPAEAMRAYRWVRPELVAEVEFAEWTLADELRHSRFVALRDDKDPKDVRKEHWRSRGNATDR